jgi:hypothetical protein
MASPEITAPQTGHAQVYGEGGRNKNTAMMLGIGLLVALILIAIIFYAVLR